MDGLKERILEVASQDEDFGKQLSEAGAPEAVVELLRERGLDVAVEDLQALAQPADQDAVELSYSGAQVIHPKTINPLENKQIPLLVKPFGDPEAAGSRISADGTGPIDIPVYIWRKNQILITMRAKDFGFVLEESLSEIFDIIHRHRLKVSLIQSSAVTISVSVDNTRFVPDAIEELKKQLQQKRQQSLLAFTKATMPTFAPADFHKQYYSILTLYLSAFFSH